jgi:ADP-ribose pyrophosphatase YjhB (NUDIX family)
MRWPLSFCPDCGVSLPPPASAHHVACPACGGHHYRNAKPCAGVLIVRDGRLLLARRGIEPARGAWNVVGGFLDADEAPEAGALREALEETGLTVRLTRLVGLFPDRYGDDGTWTLNIYYEAEAGPGEPVPQSDVAELVWFDPDDLPEPMAFPHERDLLTAWRRSRPPAANEF